VASGVTVVALLGLNLTDHLLRAPWWSRAIEAGALLLFARLSGLPGRNWD
jgi:hypothetical protein